MLEFRRVRGMYRAWISETEFVDEVSIKALYRAWRQDMGIPVCVR